MLVERGWFSPHAWGWSADRNARFRPVQVLPTRVGMVRASGHRTALTAVLPTRVGMVRYRRSSRICRWRSPHPRGDGPGSARSSSNARHEFSPHAWGWSALASSPLSAACGSPHTRGDGPACGAWSQRQIVFSPHAWGWSVVRLQCCVRICGSPHTRGDGPDRSMHRCWSRDVLPTRVGMVRSSRYCGRARLRFSPPAWGWSALP